MTNYNKKAEKLVANYQNIQQNSSKFVVLL